jgi:hypothetical protein
MKAHLSALLEGLSIEDLRTLRAIINGKLGKRNITPEQQAKMQAARLTTKSGDRK